MPASQLGPVLLQVPSSTQGLSQLAADVLAQLGELALILLSATRVAARDLTLQRFLPSH